MTLIILVDFIFIILAIYTIRKDYRNFYGYTFIVSFILLMLKIVHSFILYYFTVASMDTSLRFITAGTLILAQLVMIAIGILLVVNYIILVKKEGLLFASRFPLVLGTLSICYPFLKLFVNLLARSSQTLFFIVDYLSDIPLYFLFIFLSYILFFILVKHMRVCKEYDYIIVLGASLIGEVPSPILASRLECAISNSKSNTKFIVSGGRGHDEVCTEAYAMKKYLLSKGISNNSILLEEVSTNTYENLKYSKELVGFNNKRSNFLIVSNDFHVPRALSLSRKLNIEASARGSTTQSDYQFSAIIRECSALIVSNVGVFILYCFVLILIKIV